MATWEKVKFFHDTMLGSEGSTLTATSTESTGNIYDVDNLYNWLVKGKWKAEDSGLADPQYITYDAGANLGSELMDNIGFETAGGGGADVFAEWIEIASDGSIDDETTLVNSGSHACKLTQGSSLDTKINQTMTVIPGDVIDFNFYTRGDGTYDGRYQIYDITNGAPIVGATSTGVTGTTYTQITKRFTVPALCVTLRIQFYPAATDTAVAYFDDCSLKVDTATAQADYLIIYKHNLYTAGVTVTLQYSTDNFDTDVNDAFVGVAATSDTLFFKDFNDPGAYRYWRVKIAGHGATAPYMSICVWGQETEIDYVTAAMDPDADDIKANINITVGGNPAGIHEKYANRQFTLTFDGSDTTVYTKLRAWRNSHGLRQFFVGWEIGNNPDDIWLMRPAKGAFSAPWDGLNTAFRNITIPLVGLKEAA